MPLCVIATRKVRKAIESVVAPVRSSLLGARTGDSLSLYAAHGAKITEIGARVKKFHRHPRVLAKNPPINCPTVAPTPTAAVRLPSDGAIRCVGNSSLMSPYDKANVANPKPENALNMMNAGDSTRNQSKSC